MNAEDIQLSTLENVVLKIWEEIMGEGSGSLEDDFFDWGGNSIIATQIIAVIRNYFEVEVTQDEFYGNTKIQSMAKLLVEKAKLRMILKDANMEELSEDNVRITI